ncbi:hypothetical protein BDR05DRAFT_946916 [Suillus weaverae]|nr:hypothetical protein BDR05DRAFT_946916 [Suillus weaverae]
MYELTSHVRNDGSMLSIEDRATRESDASEVAIQLSNRKHFDTIVSQVHEFECQAWGPQRRRDPASQLTGVHFRFAIAGPDLYGDRSRICGETRESRLARQRVLRNGVRHIYYGEWDGTGILTWFLALTSCDLGWGRIPTLDTELPSQNGNVLV